VFCTAPLYLLFFSLLGLSVFLLSVFPFLFFYFYLFGYLCKNFAGVYLRRRLCARPAAPASPLAGMEHRDFSRLPSTVSCNALRLIRRYALVANGIGAAAQASAAPGSILMGGRCISLSAGQYPLLRDLAGSRFRQLYNESRPGGFGGAEIFRLAVQHLDRADSGLPQLRWFSDGAPIHAPIGANRRGASHHLGPPVRSRSSPLPLTASDADRVVWRSLLYCTSSALAGIDFGAISHLHLTAAVVRHARRHSKDSGLTADQFYAGLLVQVLRGRVGGQAWRPQSDGSPVGQWWKQAAVTLSGLAGFAAMSGSLPHSIFDARSLCIDIIHRNLVDSRSCPPAGTPFGMPLPVFVENSQGMLRFRPYMVPLAEFLQTLTYCSALTGKTTRSVRACGLCVPAGCAVQSVLSAALAASPPML
jgi:hypothetical protein